LLRLPYFWPRNLWLCIVQSFHS